MNFIFAILCVSVFLIGSLITPFVKLYIRRKKLNEANKKAEKLIYGRTNINKQSGGTDRKSDT